MGLGARLELRQGQSLVITPQLQQAIKLLQLSTLELETFVELELEKNPLLAREEPVAEAEPPSEAASDETYAMMDEPGRAGAELDARPDDLHDCAPGDFATGDAPAPAADVGGADGFAGRKEPVKELPSEMAMIPDSNKLQATL